VAKGKNSLRLPLLLVLGLGLSACAAAAIPLTAAEIGVGGFEAFKLVQTSTGGSVGVSFPQKDGQEIPPQPLPLVKRVAVWPNDENEMYLAENLMASKRFAVTTPGKVRVILANAKISPNIKDLTAQEQLAAFSVVCRNARTDLILAARDAGSVNHSNGLSFSNADKITKSDLMVFSCANHAVVWRDEMTLKVELGDKMPTTAEISKIGGDAWAARIIAAETKNHSQVGELTK
jgi:hypothetical protein